MDPDTLTRPVSEPMPLNNGDEPKPEIDWHTASDAPAAITLGWCVADVYAACSTRLRDVYPMEMASQIALELTRAALNSRLVETLLIRKG